MVANGKIKRVEAGSDCAWASSVTLRSTREVDIFGIVARSCKLRHEEVEKKLRNYQNQAIVKNCYGVCSTR